MKWYYAYLMVEFNLTSKLPVSIGVFGESQNQISTLKSEHELFVSELTNSHTSQIEENQTSHISHQT